MASIARCLRAARPASLSTISKRVSAPVVQRIPACRSFSVTSSSLIRKYTKDHEWIDLSADNKTGVIGISEYAAEQLGDVVYVELPSEGESVNQGDTMGAVESVKSASDINAPISCKIVHTNILLEEKPATINQVPEDDSHGGGWIAKVEVDEQGVKDMESLMSAEEYKTFVEGEHH